MANDGGTRIERLRTAIESEIARWGVTGLAIGILDGGETETAAYGVENIHTGAPVRPETLFQIGSISKIFTTTLVMSLVDEGALDLDRPVIGYLPDLPLADESARATITLRHLVTHMSGFFGDRFDDHGRGDDALAGTVAAFGDLPQQTAPGELWTYCNAGFDLAGRVAEVVTGKTFESLVRDRVFEPLGLDRATYFPDEAILFPVAVGHAKGGNGEPVVAKPWPIPRNSNPAGGVSANVGELLRFASMHMQDGELDGKRVISAESARAMRTQQTIAAPFSTWGLGWQRREVDGALFIEHGGATNGFMARLVTIPERNFAIAILTNHAAGGSAHTEISRIAIEMLLGIRDELPPVVTLEPDQLARYAGAYSHRLADLTLTVNGNGYDVTRVNRNPFSGAETQGDPFRLSPVSERVFLAEGGGLDRNFADIILNDDGSVRFLRLGGRLAYPKAG
ncbi:MAG: beta-lactamase family protein [Thermomicrobiales bacterium]|nr:beta-lactamase family protein [Thermomicrobiales bacterium]